MKRNILGAITMLALACIGETTPQLQAQTTFIPPQRATDVTRYTWVEECLAAAQRVEDSVQSWGPIRYDTLSWRPFARITQSVDIARRCSARFPAATASLDDFGSLLKLYQASEQHTEVQILLNRKFATIAPTAVRERFDILEVAVANTLILGPTWYAAAESLHVERMKLANDSILKAMLGDSIFFANFSFYTGLMEGAKSFDDSVWKQRAAKQLISLSEQASPAELRTDYYARYGKYVVFEALNVVGNAPLLDSLRISTRAYATLQRNNWAQAARQSSALAQFPIGNTAPSIQGAVWFPKSEAAVPYPQRGRVSLIVFVNVPKQSPDIPLQSTCARSCSDAIATIKRLKQRFPALQITFVGNTKGYFREAIPPTPEEEAEWLRTYLFDYWGLSGALAVERTSFWRLPAPDFRRVDSHTPNQQHYSFGGGWPLRDFGAFLIDEQGIIVEATRGLINPGPLNRGLEAHFADLIGILLRRATKS